MASIEQLNTLFINCNNAPSAELIGAIYSTYSEGEMPKLSLSALLDRHITLLSEKADILCTKQDVLNSTEKELLALAGQLLAANVLILLDMNSIDAAKSNLLMFIDYAAHSITSRYDFAATAIKIMSYNIVSTGYDWSIIKNSESLDMLAYQLCNKSRYNEAISNHFEYIGRGYVDIRKDVMKIMSTPLEGSGVVAYSLDDGKIEVVTRNSREERLKSSDSNSAKKLESFAKGFLISQYLLNRDQSRSASRRFNVGDKVTLKYLGVVTDDNGERNIRCEIMDCMEPICGQIISEELVKGLYTEDLIDYIYDDDCFPDAVIEYADEQGYEFSIRDSYRSFAEKKAREDEKNYTVFKAKAFYISDQYKRIYWMTPSGYGAVSFIIDGVKVGDIKIMEIDSIHPVNKDLYINIREPKYENSQAVREWDDNSVLENYVVDVKDALQMIKGQQVDNKEEYRRKNIVKRFASILCCEGKDSLDTYRHMLCSEFLYNCIDEDWAALKSSSEYLRCCIEYAQTGKVSHREQDVILSSEKDKILRCLSMSGDTENIHNIASLIDKDGLKSTSNQIASLLLAQCLSVKFQDTVSLSDNELRKKISELLGVADQFCEKGEEVYGKYGKGENSNREFKSSYVFRNDMKNKRVPDIDYQGRGQVFEAVCAFLNTNGGEVYIGVNDKTGDPILSEDYGLNADIKWLSENFDTLKMTKSKLLGHPIPKADSKDHMVLFLNTEKELYFSETLQNFIEISVTEDQDAICIRVSPSKFEIAYLYKNSKQKSGGVAFKRDGNSTRPMSDHDKEVRMMSLMEVSKTAKFAATIQDAINGRNRLIFRNYASGNTGTRKDRHVFPINLFYNNENVYCWDLEDNVPKQFRLARIESIELDGVQNYFGVSLAPGKSDVFRWVYEGAPKHIRIRMKVRALNYLLEEYSNAKNLPKEELYEESKDVWILDTYLQGFGAIRRFYLGLADQIEILDTEDSEALKADIADFLRTNFTKF